MEVLGINIRIFVLLAILLASIIGYIVGKTMSEGSKDGIIFIESTEDPDRDRIRFVLNMELDDIRKKHRINFIVKTSDSQNSQSV